MIIFIAQIKSMLDLFQIQREYDSFFNKDLIDPILMDIAMRYKNELCGLLEDGQKELLSDLKTNHSLVIRAARESHTLYEFMSFIKSLEEMMSRE